MLEVVANYNWSFVFNFQRLWNKKAKFHKSSNIHFAYCKILIRMCNAVSMGCVERHTTTVNFEGSSEGTVLLSVRVNRANVPSCLGFFNIINVIHIVSYDNVPSIPSFHRQ